MDFYNRIKKSDKTNGKMNIDADKANLRSDMKAIVHSYCANMLKAQHDSAFATTSFVGSELYAKARTLLAFVSSFDEMDTIPLIRQALKDGKRVAVPRVVNGSSIMDFYYLDANQVLESQLEIGMFGIKEPKVILKKLDADNLPLHTVVLVPGLAFSRNGNRLGRGKGYYDRFIEKLYTQENIIRLPIALVGWGFGVQIFDDIPIDDNDAALTHLVTENGLIACL